MTAVDTQREEFQRHRVIRARVVKGWSREDLARRAHLSQEQMRRLEEGISTRPRPSTVLRLAKALKVPVETLWGIEEDAA